MISLLLASLRVRTDGNPAYATCFLILALLFTPVQSYCQERAPLFVEVRESQIRAEPKVWARSVSRVSYGDQLTELSRAEPWVQVRTAGGEEGFIHLTALTARQVVIPGRSEGQLLASDGSDVVLAGKGFSNDVEGLLRSGAKEANYEAVDSLAQLNVSAPELEAFLAQGSLRLEG